MNNTDNIVFNTLNKIRSSVIFSEKSFFNNYYIARTGIYCRMPGIAQPLFIGGFSCKNNGEQAKTIARFEVAERTLATYYLSNPLLRDRDYPLFSIHSGKNIDFIKPEKVLLGTTSTGQINDTDAVGLGFHINKNDAINHSIFELLERHILGKIWYEKHPLIQISEITLEKQDYIILDFTIESEKILPFVMSVLFDKKCNLLCVGASFSTSILKAVEKARCEAIMLANDVISSKSIINITNKANQERMLSQKNGTLSLKRRNYLLNLTSRKINTNLQSEITLLQSLEILHLKNNDIYYCLLHESEYGYLARAVTKKLITLREYRRQFAHTEKSILDPIC